MTIQTVRQRAALKARREPHWHRLATGQHLGFRKTADGGSWIARFYDAATGQRHYRALGDLSGTPAHEQFDIASGEARDWLRTVSTGGSPEVLTVADACKQYVEAIRDGFAKKARGDAAADDAKARFRRHVDGDPLGRVRLDKLRDFHIEEWRKRLIGTPATPARRGPNCRAPARPKRARTDSAVNRDMTTLRAALNFAKDRKQIATDSAWAVPLRPIKGAGRRREIYLTREQRRALIEALPNDCAAFVTGLATLPLRPGALAALTAGDFDKRGGTLRVGKDKNGKPRTILLPKVAADMLREQCKGKLPTAPLFARAEGKGWDKDSWKGPIRTAVEAAGLPPGTVAYSLRHSAITDLVTAGLPLLTVAQLSGTSAAMIEQHYGHLQAHTAQAALAELSL